MERTGGATIERDGKSRNSDREKHQKLISSSKGHI